MLYDFDWMVTRTFSYISMSTLLLKYGFQVLLVKLRHTTSFNYIKIVFQYM